MSCTSLIVLLLLPTVLVPLWIKKVHRIESEVKLISHTHHQRMLSGMENTTKLLSPTDREFTNLKSILSLPLNMTDSPFSTIETEVAPALFAEFSRMQNLSQLSYIVSDGFLFSYYIKDDQTYAVYSNTSSAFAYAAGNNYSWYTQPVNSNTGKIYGDPVKVPPLFIYSSSWFEEALTSRNGHVSVGIGWANDKDLLHLDFVSDDQRRGLSLGFSLKVFTDFFWNNVNIYGGTLYLATKDGMSILTEGIPNTQLVPVGDSASIQLINSSGDQIGNAGDLMCQPYDGNLRGSVLKIWKKKYLFYCFSVEVVGVQSVYALALPYNELIRYMYQDVDVAVVLLIVITLAMFVSICTFIFLVVRAARREMYLCAALIKQLEATQQAERKSMNKSLAFARASHDIRGILAAIIGLIQICCKKVAPGSDLQTHLTQAETCTEDLLGMLTSILDTSKIEAGKILLEEEEFDLEQLLEDVVDLYYSVGMEKGVDVMLDPCDGSARKCCHVKGDKGKLKQILSNLLSNAVKFTSEGHVSVRVWAKKPCFENQILASNRKKSIRCIPSLLFRTDDRTYKDLKVINSVQQDPNCMEFLFEVSDTGKGIPKEKHKMVFENYVQVKDTALGQGGTGLGLGIVQSLVRIMGGEIAIVEKELGEKGTCFRFNTFFIVSESESESVSVSGTDAREEDRDIESHGAPSFSSFHPQPGPSICMHSPKAEGSHVVLFMSNEERSKISKKFMESLGIKVSAVKQCEQLSRTLKSIKQKLITSRMNSSQKTDVKARTHHHSRSMSSNSSSRSKEVPLSAFDGTDAVSSSEKTSPRSPSNFILIVIDTSAGPFREIRKAVAEFRRDLCSTCNRIVWLDRPDNRSINVLGLKKDKLPPMDLVISKPFHGSRLYQVIGLLPELGGKMPATTIKEGNTYQTGNVVVESSNLSISAHEQFKSIHHSPENREIQEIGCSNSTKALYGKKVLVVDDNAVLRELAKRTVSQLGADIVTCKSGEEALQIVCKNLRDGRKSGAHQIVPFDYILMDCEMKEMDGYEATRRIREEEKKYGVYIPIFAVTAHTAGEETKKIVEAGMDVHLSKPLIPDQLLNAISCINGR